MKIKLILLVVLLSVPLVGAYAQAQKDCEFCGSFYPKDPKELNVLLDDFFTQANPELTGKVLAILVPHAGYVYSGLVAAYGFKALAKQNIETVILLGASHRYLFQGVAVYPQGKFVTPLGALTIDQTLAEEFQRLDFVFPAENYFFTEHCLEVELPFIQRSLGNVKILPLISSVTDQKQLKQLAAKIAQVSLTKNVLLVVSSDLSHYLKYDQAKTIDQDTLRLIQGFDWQTLYQSYLDKGNRACALAPIITLMLYAQSQSAELKLLKYLNSGDTAGSKNQVVGYAAVAAVKPVKEEVMAEYNLSDQEKKYLLSLARKTLESYLKTKKIPKLEQPQASALKELRGAFVTLTKQGQLRGCIGRIVSDTPLYQVIPEFAVHAAVDDPRFPPVNLAELNDLKIEISVLTPFTKVNNLDEIKVGKHGLMIRQGFRSGLLLPQVATEWGWDRKTFLEQTCHKAGLPLQAYLDKNSELEKFSAIVFNETDY